MTPDPGRCPGLGEQKGLRPAHAADAAPPRRDSSLIIPRSSSAARGAFTLVELMVVITIMVIVMGLAATMMRPDIEGRRVREAARMVNVYLSSARNRAIEIGRPCGVVLHRLVNPNGTPSPVAAAMSMDQVESPPPFAGQNLGAAVEVIDVTFLANGDYYWPVNTNNPTGPGYTVLKVRVRCSPNDFYGSTNLSLVHPGDLVQLGGQGPYYTIVSPDTSPNVSSLALAGAGGYQDYPLCSHPGQDPSSIDFSGGTLDTADPLKAFVGNYWLTVRLDPSNSMQTPWPPSPKTSAATDTSWSPPVPFSILRQGQAWSSLKSTNYQGHLAKGSESALQLPGAAVVDLNWSGCSPAGPGPVSLSPTPLANGLTPGDATILFGPTGSVISVSIANDPSSPYIPTQPIYLLIGKREKVGLSVIANNPNPLTMTNWQDLQNVWVSINQQNGLVSSRAITAVSTNSSDVDYVAPLSPPTAAYTAAAIAISRASNHLTSTDVQALGGQ
jgi:prepilin-type N-terminal cleavage/methylation domain-containing protein